MNVQQHIDMMKDYKSSFMKDGYALIKNVFTAEEIEHFRMLAYNIRFDQGDLLASKHLSMLVYDKRITNIAKAIIGNEIFYFGDSTCNFNGPITNYHKDNADRYNQDGPDWKKEEYSVIRIGIYLQDHKSHSQGLSIRSGSHLFPDFTSGTPIYMDSEVGDVVVWSLKTTHMGMTDATKDNKTPLSRNHDLDATKVLPPPECDRIAIFISYGNNSPETIRFMDYLRTRFMP
ncbi:hypothetical protein LH51_11695 [Nitrincola sp. A-D6]|uniref:hypothetical protein n=1 Tax=Nitrincola sp. A-D6 TaxID=1545442 RepID=UPI00051FDA1F|nr:hypothetical protein [Nitrincola sp. A-D6]KGK41851.1 hypothetical protein LH51_11695 [Nitrincola sp. A-D6]